MASTPLGNLRGLAAVYFGEAWDDIGETPDAVVDAFVGNQGAQAARETLVEIESALDGATDDDLGRLWQSSLRSAFRVPPTGLTYRQWFEHLADMLRGHLDA